MKTLEQIKKDYAVSLGYENWNSLILDISLTECSKSKIGKLIILESFMDKICEIAQRESLKTASENINKYVDSEITNENNIIK